MGLDCWQLACSSSSKRVERVERASEWQCQQIGISLFANYQSPFPMSSLVCLPCWKCKTTRRYDAMDACVGVCDLTIVDLARVSYTSDVWRMTG